MFEDNEVRLRHILDAAREAVSFMEGQPAWHFVPPSDEDLRRGLIELGVSL